MKDSVIVEALNGQEKAKYCIIWLHGLGANGHDFEGIVPELKTNLAIKYVFPNAPQMPITVNNNMVMPAWYDIRNVSSISEDVDWQGMKKSEDYLNQLIQFAEQEGFNSQQIILAGFSQGGAIAYRAGLQTKKPLAGIIALSTYLPINGQENIQQPITTPILIAHGTQDSVVSISLAKDAQQKLTKLGYKPQIKNYPMQHEVCLQQIKDIAEFIEGCFN